MKNEINTGQFHVKMGFLGNGQRNFISTSVSIFFDGNGIRFGKYEYGNGIGLRGSMEMNQYGC